jgi:hypothetical protein
MSTMAQKVNNQARSVTVDTTIVSIREPSNHSPHLQAAAGFQRLLWPLMAIGVAALSTVLWIVGLFWLLGRAILS